MYTSEIFLNDNELCILADSVHLYDKISDKAYRNHTISISERLNVQLFKLRFDCFYKNYLLSKKYRTDTITSHNK